MNNAQPREAHTQIGHNLMSYPPMGFSDLFLGPRLFLMLERGFSLNNQLLTRVRIRSAITGIGMHVVQWAELTTLLVLSLSAPFFFFFFFLKTLI